MNKKNTVAPLFGFLSLIFCFISVACFFLKTWAAFWIFIVLLIATLIAFVSLRFSEIVNFTKSRQLRYGANVALSIVGVVGIAVFANIIVKQRFDKRADLTESQRYSLSEQTRQILKNLDKQVQVIAFFKDTNFNAARVKNLLELYQYESKYIKVSFKDPDIEFDLKEKYQFTTDGITVFDDGERYEKVTVVDEQPFTSAFLKLIRNKNPKIYFLDGHKERGIEDFNNTGFSNVKIELEKQNYIVERLSFLTMSEIPTDCELLVIAGPKTQFKSNEIKLVDKYLKQNGKLLLLFDPSSSAEDVNSRLVQLIRKWGVEVGNDRVVDLAIGRYDIQVGPTAPVPQFAQHEITRLMRYLVAFPNTRSVIPVKETKENLSVKTLAKTGSPAGVSWGETERKADGTFGSNQYDPDIDTPGPVSVAVAVEQNIGKNTKDKDKEDLTKIVVFGGSDFASNLFFNGANQDLLLASVNWLTEEEDLISIRPIDLSNQILRRMTAQNARIVQLTSVFLIPLIVFITGMVVWWCRREGEVV